MNERFRSEPEQPLHSQDLDILTPRERQVYEMREGLSGEPPMAYTEIAERLGITASTARRAAMRACKRLGIDFLESKKMPEQPEKIDPAIANHPWFPIASKMTTEEIDVLEMSTENFSDTEIGNSIGIGGYLGARAIKKELAGRFNISVDQLMQKAPEILELALAVRP